MGGFSQTRALLDLNEHEKPVAFDRQIDFAGRRAAALAENLPSFRHQRLRNLALCRQSLRLRHAAALASDGRRMAFESVRHLTKVFRPVAEWQGLTE